MGEGTSIINLGELSKPATVLIEKISDAVGGVFRPYQIRRVAQAEADADIIAAKSEIKLTELHKRAFHRFVTEEAKKQENIESITAKALPQLDQKAAPQSVEDDWITNFFDKCRIVSDHDMQTLWSKVLAGEANSPGTFSKRTVDFLSSLDKQDAILFQRLCGFAINGVTPIFYDINHQIYADAGITFDAIAHLDNIGLIRFESLAGFELKGLRKHGLVKYFGALIIIEFPNEENNSLEVGSVLLSRVGQQLAPLCGACPAPGFLDYVVGEWAKRGLILFSPYPSGK